MFDQWANNIMTANTAGTTADPMYANYAAASYNASPAQYAGKEAAAQADINETVRQNEVTAKAKTDTLEEQRKENAKNATMEMRPDGMGYYFYDGNGQQLNINQFSLLTGKRPDEILADSDNPRDQKFVQDYQQLKEISSAWVNGDTDYINKLRANPANVYTGEDGIGHNKVDDLLAKYGSPSDMVNAFREYYSDFYGTTKGKNTESPAFSPAPAVNDDAYAKLVKASAGGGTSIDALQNPNFMASQASSPAPAASSWLDKVPILNRLSGAHDARSRYLEQLKNNPWQRYYNYTTGAKPGQL